MNLLQKRTKLGLLGVAFMMAFVLAPAEKRAVYADGVGTAAPDDKEVVLTGCVIRGDEGGKEYLLTNVLPASIDMSTRAAQSGTAANASGKLAGSSNVVYWLDDLEDDDDLPNYAGKRVEVRGELEGDVERGEMEIEREGDWVEIEIKSDGREVKTRIPYVSVMPNRTGDNAAVGTSGGMKDDDEIELNINVRKIDVKGVRVVSGTCAN
jgi:hypothetical protein